MSKTITVLLTLMALLSTILLAGTTGKISGQITDAETGEGLPGVNVQVVGTALGASTDLDGVYVILNVPPGLHTVEYSFIGYKTMRVKEVRVNVDFTTRLNQSLPVAAVEGETVEVFGERNPLVRQDLTNTQVAITAETVADLPVDNLRDVIKLQAGIVEDNDGSLHIRGGRSNEIAFQVNGISINNPFGNTQGVGLATNAVEEVSVSAGTFSAEYGNALSGVINFVTKDGGNDYNLTLRGYTGDHFSSRDDIFFNIDERDFFNNSRFEWTLSGPMPLFGDKLTFFASGVWQENNGHLYGQRIYTTNDLLLTDPNNPEIFLVDPIGLVFEPGPNGTILPRVDSTLVGASGNGETVPMVTSKSLNLTGKLTWKPLHNLKFTYDVIFDDDERFSRTANGVNMFRRYRFNPDGRPQTVSENISQSFGITHTLSKKTFYTLKVGYNFNKARTSVFEDPLDQRYVPVLQFAEELDRFTFTNDVTQLLLPQTDIHVGGTDLEHTTEKATSILGKLDVVSQILPKHELKFGGEVAFHELDLESFTLAFIADQQRFIIPTPQAVPNSIRYQAYVREPVQAAFYVLDKMELADKFILNAGLRYEYLDTRTQYNADLQAAVDDSIGSANSTFFQDATPKHRVSPRLSLSFPITSRGIIRFSYGFFFQNPTFRNIYRNPFFIGYREGRQLSGIPNFGNANLRPQRSIQYEMGLQQQFTEDIKIDLTVFYKDVNDLIERRRVVAGEVGASREFNVITNISLSLIHI